jgi:ATPase subunit of ABC transporter with duplicated ATPase domains
MRRHRYGLIGRNGCGKSTLLQRLASKTIPGMPMDMRILLVQQQQQIDGSDDSSVRVLMQADTDRTMLMREQEAIEDRMQEDDIIKEELMRIVERLGDVMGELDAMSADTAEERALEILKGRQFTIEMIHGPTQNLSGGWRMRLALAKALFVPSSDLMLFDECTNHLDLYGLDWLIQFLNENADRTLIEADEPVIKMHFPNPTWPPGIGEGGSIIRMEDLTFGFQENSPLLDIVTLSLNRGSKVALVGKNGSGKTTLLSLIGGNLTQKKESHLLIDLWSHPNIKIGHVTQYSVEELERYADQAVVEYAERELLSGKASASIVAKASGNIRQYLGAFGLGGKHAHREIGKLSGGERMRLCFATVLAEEPHLLLLDESTNHVDIETLDSMLEALNAFDGSVLMISHNQSFLSRFCKELWVLEDGHVAVSHSDTESFDEIFSEYRRSILQGGKSLTTRRREKAGMAKRAAQPRIGARETTALF